MKSAGCSGSTPETAILTLQAGGRTMTEKKRWWDKLKQTEPGAGTNWPRNVLRDAKLTQLPWEVPDCFALGHQNFKFWLIVRLVCNCYKGMRVRNIETGFTAAQAQRHPVSMLHEGVAQHDAKNHDHYTLKPFRCWTKTQKNWCKQVYLTSNICLLPFSLRFETPSPTPSIKKRKHEPQMAASPIHHLLSPVSSTHV